MGYPEWIVPGAFVRNTLAVFDRAKVRLEVVRAYRTDVPGGWLIWVRSPTRKTLMAIHPSFLVPWEEPAAYSLPAILA